MTQLVFDLAGRKLTQTDPRNNTTTFTYDAAGHMTSTRDAVGNLTQYGYDVRGAADVDDRREESNDELSIFRR